MCLLCFSFVCRTPSDAPHDRLVCELSSNQMGDVLLIHKRLLLIIPLGGGALSFVHLNQVSKIGWHLINDLRGGCMFPSHLRDSL